jgi:septal ring factor EnvC (AmiA/AmiB activator)
MTKASEAIHSLRPVTFRYKKEIDATRSLSFGLIAEEVAKVDPNLVTPDREGKPETVRYEAVNAMLLNEFLKEHKKVEEQRATIAELKSTVALQQKEFQTAIAEQRREIESVVAHLKAQDARIQRVNGELEMNGTIRQVVANKP